ncbi:MAG: DUF4397 domain-containing protein, partial [Woeseia sp.]|nr:DUF4397 domain-containing protein [Woeseia sp.]
TIAAVNNVAAIEPVVISQPDTAVGAGAARLFVLHGAAAAPQVDVFVTVPDADLAATAPVGTFSFKETIRLGDKLSASDVNLLRDQGITDGEIVEIIARVRLATFGNFLNNVAKTEHGATAVALKDYSSA